MLLIKDSNLLMYLESIKISTFIEVSTFIEHR